MIITYSGASAPTAQRLADEDDDILTRRASDGDINWGRATANTQLNPDISNTTNKRVMRELFAEHDVPMPTLYTAEEVEDILDSGAYGTPGTRFIGRPDQHTRGRGFWRIYDHETLRKALRGTRKKQAATHFMEFVDAPHEYRVHIFNGKSLRISEKDFHGSEGNHQLYTTIKPTGEVKHVRKAAKKAIKALGLDFGAVDILASDTDCWVLEVNAAPSLGGSMPRVYAAAFKDWYAENV